MLLLAYQTCSKSFHDIKQTQPCVALLIKGGKAKKKEELWKLGANLDEYLIDEEFAKYNTQLRCVRNHSKIDELHPKKELLFFFPMIGVRVPFTEAIRICISPMTITVKEKCFK